MTNYSLTLPQREFLVDLQRRCYRFFDEAADPETGLVSDRARATGESSGAYASVASCGFALVAHAVAAEAAFVSRADAEFRAERLLSSLTNVVAHERGVLFHFVDKRTGLRHGNCEASSIDTALAVAGAMVARQAFASNAAIRQLADALCERVDWQWMLDAETNTLKMAWRPEQGFGAARWNRYSESILVILIAIGAGEHAIAPECWRAWERKDILHYRGEPFVSYPPLFVHQYPHGFFDFRSLQDDSGRNYWRNAELGHLAQIEFMKGLASKYPDRFAHYNDDLWGLTSSDSQRGYKDWGGPYADGELESRRGIDGTVVPSAAAGGLPIVPEQALRTLLHQRDHCSPGVYAKYGFVNAHNPATGWVGRDVIGIDTGITLLMAENLRTGNVWKWFMQHPSATRALERCGFAAHPG